MSFHLLYYIILNFKKKQVPLKIYELSYMTTALYDLQNIDIKVRNYQNKDPETNSEEYRQYFENECKREIERNFIKIIEKEQSFKTNINEFIQSNNR